MITAIADTHAIIWYLWGDERLSAKANHTIENAIADGDTIAISAITPIEIVYLMEKSRISSQTLIRLKQVLDQPDSSLLIVPVDFAISQVLGRVKREQVPDMPDRIIAATALHLGVPVISRDGKINASDITTIW